MGFHGLFRAPVVLSTLGTGQSSDDADRLHADDLIRVLEERLKDDAAMKEEALWEALADAFMLRRTFARSPEERKDFARKADRISPGTSPRRARVRGPGTDRHAPLRRTARLNRANSCRAGSGSPRRSGHG